MLRKRADLPLANQTHKSPTPPRRQLDMPDITPAHTFSFLWVLGSLVLVGIGYLHCSWNSAQAKLYCAEDLCRITRSSPESQGIFDIQFLRENLMKAEIAHLDKQGNLVQGKRASRRQKRGMPQTVTVTWKDAETQEETTAPLALFGLGKKTPRKTVNDIMDYVRKQADTLDIDLSRWLSGIGILCFVFGGLLFLMRIAVGSLAAPAPSRRPRPAPRTLFK